MPYEIRNGTEVWHNVGGKWSLKQKCTSAKNAELVTANLEALESGKLKKWGARFAALKGKK